MLNRPNQSTSNKQQNQTSQSKSTAKWKTYDDPVQIPILMYHAVHVMDPSEASNANLIVAPDNFEAQIKAMVDTGYYFLTPEETYKAFSENSLPAKKVVWLTFDDGNEDFYTIAYPILKKYKAKATNNIITGFVKKGNVGNLTVKQMKEMMAHGMSFQSHTVNHPDLSVTDKATQKDELTNSIDFLEDKLNTKVNTIGQCKISCVNTKRNKSVIVELQNITRKRFIPMTQPTTELLNFLAQKQDIDEFFRTSLETAGKIC